MRLALSLILILNSMVAQAQLDTGGSAMGIFVASNEVFKDLISSHHAALSFVEHLKSREKACGKKTGILEDNINLKDVYLKLKLYESTHSATHLCPTRDRMLACLRHGYHKHPSANYDRLLKTMVAQPAFKKYLATLYQIKDDEADEIIRYFEKLAKKRP